MTIEEILQKQREYFKSGATLCPKFRKHALEKLYDAIKKNEKEINEALKADLSKSSFETYMCESGLSLSEIAHMIKHTKRYSKPKRVKTPLAQYISKTYKIPSPYGNALIISPWNYPFMLAIEPLADAIAAGNTVVLKPSEFSPHTSAILEKIIKENFAPEYIAVINGGVDVATSLLNEKFDIIFFTGSTRVGQIVMESAAKNLTPCVLELGGKSPCIVEKSADIKLSARRIVFGKYLNAGQTCVAPDYILCDRSIKDELIKALKVEIKCQYGEDPLNNENYVKIINEKHYQRLLDLIEPEKVVCGGKGSQETHRIEPTILDNVSLDDKVMETEIFGPILPIVTYDKYEEVYDIISKHPTPLALYIFSCNKKIINKTLREISFGGGCVNDVVIHLANSSTGFGGVGNSGFGAYHGKVGFDAFTHYKSIVDKKRIIDLPIRYAPYDSKLKNKLLRTFLH